MNQIRQTGALALTLLTVFSGVALAEGEPQQIGTFDDWLAYSYDAADSKVCYVSSTPRRRASPRTPSATRPSSS